MNQAAASSALPAVDLRLDLGEKLTHVIELDLPGGAKICVRNDLNESTCFVLVEQGDWFEPELAFLRNFAEPGMAALDIGANHGLYGLSLATIFGPGGRVVAYEPGSSTADLLRQSKAVNGFGQLEVVEAALSDRPGEGCLFAGGASEDASLKRNGHHAGSGRLVKLMTLDQEWIRLGRPPIDIIKLDVEGHETAVIEGGRDCLSAIDPLLVFEVSGDPVQASKLSARLSAFGFAIFKVLPGLGVLVPSGFCGFSSYQTNLIAVKPPMTAKLKARGLLVDVWPTSMPAATIGWPADSIGLWRALHGGADADPIQDPAGSAVRQTAQLIAEAKRSAAQSDVRVGSILSAFELSTAINPTADPASDLAHLITRITAANLAGRREVAAASFQQVFDILFRYGLLPSEPFAVSDDWDIKNARQDPHHWLSIELTKILLKTCCHSLRYVDDKLLPYLDRLHDHALYPAELERRRQMLRIRLGLQIGLHQNSKLTAKDVNGGFVRSAA